MTEVQISLIKAKLSTKMGSPLRNLFYNKKGLPKMGLHPKSQIWKELGVELSECNSWELGGARKLLEGSLCALRKEARSRQLPWIDCETMGPNGHAIAFHGYSDDMDKIAANSIKYDEIARSRYFIAEITSKIAKQQRRLLKSA